MDGIPQPKAGDEQGGAAADPCHGHPEAFLIAKEVAHRHLPGEGQPLPDKAGPFEQHPLSRFGRPRAHQGSGYGCQGGIGGGEGRSRNAEDRRPDG